MKMNWLIIVAVCFLLLFPVSVMAYLGPGAAVSSIGALLAAIAGIIVAIFGFLWYPIRRLIRKLKKSGNDREGNSKE